MRTGIITAILALAPVFCLAYHDAQAGQAAPPQQEQNPPQPAQKAPPAGSPVSISPMIPVAPKDVAPHPPDPAAMAGMPKQPPAAPVNTRTYIIGAEDVISINVFENSGFSVPSEIVRPDGKITMPLLGEIVASEKSPEELAEEIQKVLVDRYMKEPPHVQVMVLDVRSKNYYLQGEVNKPGKYPLVVPTTVMQALVNAGGFRDFANKKDIKIQRVGEDKVRKFNYVDVSKGKHMEQDIFLKPDDRIFVR